MLLTCRAPKHLHHVLLKSSKVPTLGFIPLNPGLLAIRHRNVQFRRQLTYTRRNQLKEFFPEPDAPHIKITKAAWSHPIYTEEQMKSIVIAHREAQTWSDWTALGAVRLLRWGLDLATGYKHDKAVAEGTQAAGAASQPYAMTARKYMIRFVNSRVPGLISLINGRAETFFSRVSPECQVWLRACVDI